MLRELSIKNLAVIEEVHLSFHNGFHVLTGETGAGKSILIDALSLLVGGRGSAGMVRHGCDKAEMEALFDLPAGHPVWLALERLGVQLGDEEMLVVRRELTAQGKSASRVNGQLVTMTMLKEIGEYLVNIHGQHEHQSLLKTERHLEWLDQFGGETLLEQKGRYREAYQALRHARASLNDLEDSARHNAQMVDLYRFQIEEIASAGLQPGEDERLTEKRRRLKFAGKRMDAISEAYDLLYDGKALDAISRAIDRLNDVQSYDQTALSPLLEQLQSAYYQSEDVAFQLRAYRDQIESDPDELAAVEDRLDVIHTLKRKYGETITDILAYLSQITGELDKIENRDELLDKLRRQEAELSRQAAEQAVRLSRMRADASSRLAEVMKAELRSLQMNTANFLVQLDSPPAEDTQAVVAALQSQGMDSAAFLLSTNPGEPPKSLAKVASGGEMSRIMLALKSIFAEIDQIPTLVFDEVDTGVSGKAAQAIAEKLSALALRCQVFSITHLPQVACMSDHHYEISKQVTTDKTATAVGKLEGESRIEELARMLGGVEITEKTRHHAQEMLDLAHRLKGA